MARSKTKNQRVHIEETNDQTIYDLVVDARRRWRVHLYFIGDTHLGSVMADEEAVEKVVDIVRQDPYAVWIGTGDYADYIGPGDPRFLPSMLDYGKNGNPINYAWYYIQKQTEMVIDAFAPIREKNLFLLLGNHEQSALKKAGGVDITKMLQEAGYRVVGYEIYAMLRFKFVSQNKTFSKVLNIYVTHGFGGGRKHGSSMNRIMERASDVSAQLFVMGHVEKGSLSVSGQLTRTRFGSTTRIPQVFIVLPAFKRFGDWTDVAGEDGAIPYESRMGKPVESVPLFRVEVSYGRDSGPLNMRVEVFPDIRDLSTQSIVAD